MILVQSVMEENNKLKVELDRLREDNAHLARKSKLAQRDIETIQVIIITPTTPSTITLISGLYAGYFFFLQQRTPTRLFPFLT